MQSENPHRLAGHSAKLSIISVNFGSAEKVLNLHQSIVKNPPSVPWELIIVDNPTKKGGDGEFLEQNFHLRQGFGGQVAKNSRVHVIKLAKNVGYGEGNNEGVKFAEGEFLAICNPDTEVLAGTFDKLLNVLKSRPATSLGINSKIGIAVPVLQTKDGKILENCREFPTIWSLIKRRLFRKNPFCQNPPSPLSQRGKIRETDWAQGSFWVMKKEVYENFAGFDPRFFLFMEDIDFCRRLKKVGLETVQVPDAIAIHSPNRLSGGFIGSAIFRKTFWIHLASAVKYFWKWRS